MSKLTVYHGSPVIIEKPQFGVGNPNNDYGLGFYCTETLDLAKEWACSAETDGYANKYTLDMSDLTVLSLTGGDYNILNWLAILLENRKFRIGGDVARQARDYIFKNFGMLALLASNHRRKDDKPGPLTQSLHSVHDLVDGLTTDLLAALWTMRNAHPCP